MNTIQEPLFRGFIVANDNEEFLHDVHYSRDSATRAWAWLPGLSRVFPARRDAIRVIYRMEYPGQAYVLELYETPTQFVVSGAGPSWLTGIS